MSNHQKSHISQEVARRAFVLNAFIVFLVPILFSNFELRSFRLLADFFSGPAGIHVIAQASDFPVAVYAGALAAILFSGITATMLCMSQGFLLRWRRASAHQGWIKRFLVFVIAIGVFPAFWYWPYSKGGGSWSAPISILIAESPMALGVFFAALYFLCVSSLVLLISTIYKGDE